MSMKNPLKPAGIEPATFRIVAQHIQTTYRYKSWRKFLQIKININIICFQLIHVRILIKNSHIKTNKCTNVKIIYVKVKQSHYRPGGFQEVKILRFRDKGTGWS